MTLLNDESILHALYRDLLAGRLSRREVLQRTSLLGLSAAALAGLSATAPVLHGETAAARQENEPVRGGTVRVGIPGSAASFDPTIETVFDALWPMEHIYSNLIRLTPEMELEPELALTWGSNETAATFPARTSSPPSSTC
jgi:ABC-type transport system substrate-binding protein